MSIYSEKIATKLPDGTIKERTRKLILMDPICEGITWSPIMSNIWDFTPQYTRNNYKHSSTESIYGIAKVSTHIIRQEGYRIVRNTTQPDSIDIPFSMCVRIYKKEEFIIKELCYDFLFFYGRNILSKYPEPHFPAFVDNERIYKDDVNIRIIKRNNGKLLDIIKKINFDLLLHYTKICTKVILRRFGKDLRSYIKWRKM